MKKVNRINKMIQTKKKRVEREEFNIKMLNNKIDALYEQMGDEEVMKVLDATFMYESRIEIIKGRIDSLEQELDELRTQRSEYMAMTRKKPELWTPPYIEDWIEGKDPMGTTLGDPIHNCDCSDTLRYLGLVQ
jgi:vacuolar-type H+-ATPase subunit I/STV1